MEKQNKMYCYCTSRAELSSATVSYHFIAAAVKKFVTNTSHLPSPALFTLVHQEIPEALGGLLDNLRGLGQDL